MASPISLLRLPGRRSLQWQLPLLVSSLVVLVLALFLWTVFGQLERTLLDEGRRRAQAASEELASLLAPGFIRRSADLQRVAADPTLKQFLVDPRNASRLAAETSLRSLAGSGQQVHVIELWNPTGERLLAVSIPASADTSDTSFPARSRPTGSGVQLAQKTDGPIVADLIERIGSTEASAPLGYLVVRRPLNASQPEVLNKLLGSGARLQIGGREGAWTDLVSLTSPPPVDLSRAGPGQYRAGDGDLRLGSLAPIATTPWLVWVDYPQAIFVAPAYAFLSQAGLIGLAFVVLAGGLSRMATGWITKPLATLTDASEAIAKGDFNRRVPTNRADEIGRLGASFNSMVSQIQEAHEHLVLAVQGSNVGIWEWSADSERVMLSTQWKQMLGYADGEIEGSRSLLRELVHPDDWEAVVAGIRSCLKGDIRLWESEHRLRRKDGSYNWVLARGVAHRGVDGRPIRLAGTSIDISGQKAARDHAVAQARQAAFVADIAVALTEGGELRDMLGRCAHAMVEHLDAVMARVWTTSLAEPMLELQAVAGVDGEVGTDVPRVSIGAYTVGRIAAERRPLVTSVLEELPFISADLVARHALTSYAGFPLLIGDRLIGVISMFGRQPLSESSMLSLESVARTVALGIERKRLEESRSRFEDLLESATDFVTIGQVAGPPLYINRAAREAFGIGATELVPSLLAFRSAGFQDVFENTVLASAIRDGVWRGHADYVSRSGRVIPVSQVSVVHRNATGTVQYISTISRDMTEERRVAREREALEEQLRGTQKIEAIGQLAGGLAHDFNNLLTVILGYTQLLDSQLDAGDPRRLDLEQIQKAGDHAAQLTRQLLAFSRKQILHPVVLDLDALVQNVRPMLGSLLGEHVEVVLKSQPDLKPIRFDPTQMELILVNLAVNARDAMPHGGRFTIETENIEIDDEFSRTHLAVAPGAYVQLTINDTGCGMDAATQERIFEPFFTTKALGKGTGLGLSTVLGIVKQSGGSIWLYSEPGLGASFKIYLPTETNPLEPRAVPTPTETPAGHETILVVEDEAGVRNLVHAVLTRAGYVVVTAAHPSEALAIARNPAQPIDLVLTDVIMPDMNGAALSLQLRELRPTLRVLFMSGFADDAIAHYGVLQSGTPLLQKPFTGSALAAEVRRLLDAAPPGAPSVLPHRAPSISV
jgi:PAS domain S-box-containing protein